MTKSGIRLIYVQGLSGMACTIVCISQQLTESHANGSFEFMPSLAGRGAAVGMSA